MIKKLKIKKEELEKIAFALTDSKCKSLIIEVEEIEEEENFDE